jgi:hypothetical protein
MMPWFKIPVVTKTAMLDSMSHLEAAYLNYVIKEYLEANESTISNSLGVLISCLPENKRSKTGSKENEHM